MSSEPALFFDLFYLLALAAASPWLLWRSLRTGRYRRDLRAKLLGQRSPHAPRAGYRPREQKNSHAERADYSEERTVWFHGVSVGEVHLLGPLVAGFRARRPDWRVVVSSSTDTGLAEARDRFADLSVIPFPLDFSWAVRAAFDAVRPDAVVLAESELWPNFLAEAAPRGVPVVVANGRVSPRTFARMMRLRGFVRRFLLGRVTLFAVQTPEYAERLRRLGVRPERVAVTGSVKYDGASGDRDTPKGREFARLLARRGETVWLAGSTHAPEESIVLGVFARLRERFPMLRLILVPRHPDRFGEVAELVKASGLPFVRRSEVREPLAEMPAVVLLDSVGELGAAWGLADVGYTGGSLDGRRGGQSMIEPAGYGVPTIFGPHVWNFRDAARLLVESGGAVTVRDAAGLEAELAALLADPARAASMGAAARALVRSQQGATARTLDAVEGVIPGGGAGVPPAWARGRRDAGPT